MTPPVLARQQPVRIDVDDPASAVAAFDAVYRDAKGDPARIPWAHGKPSPALVSWLDEHGCAVIRPGARVVVVGCGLGDDAAFLAERGYEVTGFDASPVAIESARERYPHLRRSLVVADLFELPGRMLGRYDVVVEVHTVQALPPRFRGEVARGIASLLNHHGVLFVSARVRSTEVPLESLTGAPYPLTPDEMRTLWNDEGLVVEEAAGGFEVYEDGNVPPVRRMRGAFRRAE